eukprot:scaffold18105_cov60-Phaeocystis_antarctica.AAC.2
MVDGAEKAVEEAAANIMTTLKLREPTRTERDEKGRAPEFGARSAHPSTNTIIIGDRAEGRWWPPRPPRTVSGSGGGSGPVDVASCVARVTARPKPPQGPPPPSPTSRRRWRTGRAGGVG